MAALKLNEGEYKNNVKNKYSKENKKNFRVMLIFLFIFAIIIVNLSANAKISEMKYKIDDLDKKLKTRQITLDNLKVENKKSDSITDIENKAKEKLNMDYPSKDQIRYINSGN